MRKGYQDCALASPIYQQILKEKRKGYSFIACDKTNKIIRVRTKDIK